MTETRVMFAVAAEADDDLIWDRLSGIQTQLFAAGPINIKVAYFGREAAPPNRPLGAFGRTFGCRTRTARSSLMAVTWNN